MYHWMINKYLNLIKILIQHSYTSNNIIKIILSINNKNLILNYSHN